MILVVQATQEARVRLAPQSHQLGNGEGTSLDTLGRNQANEARTVLLAHVGKVPAVDLDSSGQRALVTGESTQQRGLACTVLSQQSDQFACLQRKIQPVEQSHSGLAVAVTDGKVMGGIDSIFGFHQLKYWMRRRLMIMYRIMGTPMMGVMALMGMIP